MMKTNYKKTKKENKMLKYMINPDLSVKKTNLVLGFMLIMLLAMSPSLMADTHYVDGSGSNTSPYTTPATAAHYITPAIGVASSGDIIDVTGTITEITEEGILVDKNLTIQGQGAQNTIVQAHGFYNQATNRVFKIETAKTVTIKDMTIRHGKTFGSGGGIENSGTLTVENCKIADNWAEDGGGGIKNDAGTITLTNCTINGNRIAAGWVIYGGGINNASGDMKITNCTIFDNSIYYGNGGGICNYGSTSVLTLTNCTIANNTLDYSSYHGGGIYNYSGTLNSINTIIANNGAGGNPDDFYYNSGTVNDNGYNIIETGHIDQFNNEHSITGEQANLNLSSTLEYNNTIHGTKTLKTTSESVAINAGTNTPGSHPESIPTTDQRGANRNGATDIGAYEYYDDDGSLPVELSSFTAEFLNNKPTLYWTTQSETDNFGWNVYRNTEEDLSSSQKITDEMIQGYGTTTEPSYYIYNDTSEDIIIGQTYWYWLESIDLGGESHLYNQVVNITIPDITQDPTYLETPIVYRLQSSPNPAKFSTTISFTLNKSTFAEVSIYNILGKLVKTLPMVVTTADEKSEVYWNGKDENGNVVKDGIYLYQLNVDGKAYKTNKLILIR